MTEYTYSRVIDGNWQSGDVVVYHVKQYDDLLQVGLVKGTQIVSNDASVHMESTNIVIVSVTRRTPKVEIPTKPGIYISVNKRGQQFLLMLAINDGAEQWYVLRSTGPDKYSKASQLMISMERFTFVQENLN